MRYASSLHVIQEEEEEVYEESDADTTGMTLAKVQRDRYQSRYTFTERFMEKVSGSGMVVRKFNRRGNGRRYRKLYIMGKNMYLSSVFDTKVISIEELVHTKRVGKELIMETLDHGSLQLKMPTVTDALAFIHVLGYIKGSV